ncbi:MAG: cytochrome c [Acidobacteriota bacterium]
MKTTKLILFAVACVLFTYACSQTSVTNTTNSATNAANRAALNTQPAAASDDLAAGRDLYKRNCAACHRADGTGGKITLDGKTINPENLTADKFKNRPDEKLIGYITDGNDEGMPAFKDKLKPEEIKEVVKYIRGELQKK